MSSDFFPAVKTPVEAVTPGPNYAYWGGRNLYVNLTSRCSAACRFCIHNFTWDIFGYDLRLRPGEEPSAAQAIQAVDEACSESIPAEVVFTGLGEPTLRLDVMLEVLRHLTMLALPSRLDTNGHGALNNAGREVVSELKAAGLVSVSVSLNAPDQGTYDRLCRPTSAGSHVAVVEFIRQCVNAGIETTATVVDLPEVDKDASADLVAGMGARFRVRPLLTGEKASE
jgi:cyclic pyranopterin phosphate synthase